MLPFIIQGGWLLALVRQVGVIEGGRLFETFPFELLAVQDVLLGEPRPRALPVELPLDHVLRPAHGIALFASAMAWILS